MDEEAEEYDEVEHCEVVLLFNADDLRREERAVAVGSALVPGDEAKLEEILHQHHRLQQGRKYGDDNILIQPHIQMYKR